jgi:hypothetical protein
MKLIWGEKLGDSTDPYGRRWVVDFGCLAFRLHRWYQGKLGPQEAKHDHAWGFLTFILQGGYTDATTDEHDVEHYEVIKAPAIRYRSPEHTHYVWPHKETGATTFVISGPVVHQVHYYACGHKWKPEEFEQAGPNPCDT